jgi:phage shock protein A
VGVWRRIVALIRSRRGATDDGDDPLADFDRAEAQQRHLLQTLREGLVDVATSVQELEHQAERLRASLPILTARAERAAAHGETDLARGALERKQFVVRELTALDGQLAEVKRGERDLLAAHQRLWTRIERVKRQRAVFAARRVAAESQIEVGQALSGVTGELAQLGFAVERAERETRRLQARAQALASLVADESASPEHLSADAFERALHAAETGVGIDEDLARIEEDLLGTEPSAQALVSETGDPTAIGPSAQG